MMKMMLRLVPAAVAVVLVACGGAHASPTASGAAACDLSKDGRKLGATYVTSLSATKVSCTKAKSLIKSFNKCRRAHGGADGKCTSFSGYTCSERRKAIPTQFSAKVTCKASGARRLKLAYTQFT
jgi:ABC-type glycerol-3-phosphate transport system substrate-binding protein